MSGGADVIIRLDAGRKVGSGHAVRCQAISQELAGLGIDAVFAVSNRESQGVLAEMDVAEVELLGGDPESLGSEDAQALAGLAACRGARVVLIDTYGLTSAFAKRLTTRIARPWTLQIDDLYTFGTGRLDTPVRWGFDAVVNYTIGVERELYEAAGVDGSGAEIMVGTKFAPIRPQFRPREDREFSDVRRILLTTGSTNPERSLERMLLACPLAPHVDVVIGGQADFDAKASSGRDVTVHRGLADLSGLMRECDLAVTAGGTTVLELLACGVPVAAIPIVDNQRANVEGVSSAGVGVACSWSDLAERVAGLCRDPELRRQLSARASAAVDGGGARRIARAIAERVRA